MNRAIPYPSGKAGPSVLFVKNTARKSLKPSIANGETSNAANSIAARTVGSFQFVHPKSQYNEETKNMTSRNEISQQGSIIDCNKQPIKQIGNTEESTFPELAIGPVWTLTEDKWENFELVDNVDSSTSNSNFHGNLPASANSGELQFSVSSQEKALSISAATNCYQVPANSLGNGTISSKPTGLMSQIGQSALIEEDEEEHHLTTENTNQNWDVNELRANNAELKRQLRTVNTVKCQLKTLLIDMRKEKEMLQSRISELEKSNADLITAIKNMEKNKNSLERKNTKEIERRLEISKEFHIMVTQKNNMLAQSNNLQLMYGTIQQEYNKLKIVKDKLQQELNERNGSKATVQKELNEVVMRYEKERAKQQNNLQALTKVKSELEEKLKHFEKENKYLKESKEQEILALQKDYEQIKSLTFGNMETENVMLTQTTEKLRTENSQLKDQTVKLQLRIDELSKEMSNMKDLMEFRSKALDEKSKQFRSKLSALEEDNAVLENKIKDNQKENANYKDSMETKIKDMEEIVRQFQIQINCLEKENNSLKKQKDERRKEIKDLQLSLQDSNSKNSQFEHLILILQKLNNTLEKQIEERQQQITELEHYIKNKMSEMDEKSKQCESEMSLLHNDIEKSKKVEESLRADIFQLVRKRDEITRLNNVMKFDNENLTQQCSHLRQEVQQLKVRIEAMNSGPKDQFAMQKLIEALQLKISVLKLEYYKNCHVQHNESNYVHVSNNINYSYHNGPSNDPRCGPCHSKTPSSAVIPYEARSEMNAGDRTSVEVYDDEKDHLVKRLKSVLDTCDSKDMFYKVIDFFQKHTNVSESDFSRFTSMQMQSKEKSSGSYNDCSSDDRVLILKNKKLLSDLISMERENEKLQSNVERINRSNDSLRRNLQKTNKEQSILKEKISKLTIELDELRKVKKVYVTVTKPSNK